MNGQVLTRVGRPRKRRPARKIVIVLVVLALVFVGILAAVPPIVMKDMIAGPVVHNRVYKAADFGMEAERIELRTSDGLNIVAHGVWVPEPKAVVIFLSGIHNPSVTAFFGHSRMLFDHGYSSLLVEMRAHGESEGTTIALGYKEHLDVEAAVEYLRAVAGYEDLPIVVYGLSMGGAAAINAVAHTPDIDALVSLSAFSSWEDVFSDNMIGMGAPAFYVWLQRPFVTAYIALKFGIGSVANTPKRNIARLGDRPALIMHSTGDSQIPFASFQRIVDRAPDHVETWVRPGDLHLIVEEGGFLEPEMDREYYERVVRFLDRHYGE